MSYQPRIQRNRPDALCDSLIAAVIAKAADEWKMPYEGEYPKTGFGITTLLPKSIATTNQAAAGLAGAEVVGSAAWGLSALTLSTWTDWINLSIDDRIRIVVEGIFDKTTTPHITAMRPKANGQDYGVVNIEEMHTWEEPVAWFSKPFSVGPENNFTMRVLSDATIAGAPAERIGLLGHTVAKLNYMILEA